MLKLTATAASRHGGRTVPVSRRVFVAMAGSALVTGCGTTPTPQLPAGLVNSIAMPMAEERQVLYAEYRARAPGDPMRFHLRNELVVGLMTEIDHGYRAHQWGNAQARHVVAVSDRVPNLTVAMVGPFISPPLPSGFLSLMAKDSLGLPKALLGEAYFEEVQWGRILMNIEETRLSMRNTIERKLRLADWDYTYPLAEMDLRAFWAAALPSMALARVQASDGARPASPRGESDGVSPLRPGLTRGANGFGKVG